MSSDFDHNKVAEITAKSFPDDVRIYIDGSLHLQIKKSELLGIQSWYETKFSLWIELTFKTRDLQVAYNSPENWKKVLQLLDEHI